MARQDDLKKRATPRGIIYQATGFADGAPVYDCAECPACGYQYEEGFDSAWGEPFCPRCGQALNWEVGDDADSD